MVFLIISLLILTSLVVLLESIGFEQTRLGDVITENLDLVIVGFRHAHRNPFQFLPNDPNKGSWGFEGESALTENGRKQAQLFGRSIQQRYSRVLAKISPDYQINAVSSSASRAQTTMQEVLSAILHSSSFEQQPASAGFTYSIDDKLLRAYSLKNCTRTRQIWDMIYNGKMRQSRELYEQNEELIQYVSNMTGLRQNIADMADVADNLIEMKRLNLTMPTWLVNNPFGRSIYDEVVKFSESPQILCSLLPACQRMMAGLWLNDIRAKLANAFSTTRIHLYCTHNELLSSLLWLLGHNCSHGVGFNGALTIELRSIPTSSIRVSYIEQDGLGIVPGFMAQTIRVSGCPTDDEWCPLDTFLCSTIANAVSDFDGACDEPYYGCHTECAPSD